MKKLFFVLYLGLFFVTGCGQHPTDMKSLPVLDASSQENLIESLKTVSVSVPAAQKEKFEGYVDFYTKYQFPSPKSYERLAPELNGKNYQEALQVLNEDLIALREDFDGSISRLSLAGIPAIASQPSELSKIVITNLTYNKATHVKEMDIENKTNKEISGLQVMAREDFEPGPDKKMAMFVITFPLIKPGQKAHVKEVEYIVPVQEMLVTKITANMPAVAIQAFDKDKMLVLNNEGLFEAIDALEKLHFLADEMDRVLRL